MAAATLVACGADSTSAEAIDVSDDALSWDLSLSPATAPAGTTVTVSAASTRSRRQANVYFDDSNVGTLKASGSKLTGTFKVPTTANAGDHTVRVASSNGSKGRSVKFVVSAPGTVPSSGPAPDPDPSVPPPTGSPAPRPAGLWWKPAPDKPIHWHWQLSEDMVVPRDVLPNVTVYDIDGEQTSAETVAKLHALGPNIVVICYFDAGVYEEYRSDAKNFPKSVIGKEDTGWEGSFWLDVRQQSILLPLMEARIKKLCYDKGFDAIEPDETEVWSNKSGFDISKDDNNSYNRAIAALAHKYNLSVGLKGNNTEAPELAAAFDWALTEQCWEYDECDNFSKAGSFIATGKAVFNVEYSAKPNCTAANKMHMNSSRRDLDVLGPTNSKYLYQPCVPDTQNTW